MKKLIIFLAIFAASFAAYSQKVSIDKAGNYTAIKDTTTRVTGGTPTGKTYTDTKGNVYPVMISKKGKLFVVRTSKTTGNKYNQYLKL